MIIDVCGLADQYKKGDTKLTASVFGILPPICLEKRGGGSTTKNLTHLFWFSSYFDF